MVGNPNETGHLTYEKKEGGFILGKILEELPRCKGFLTWLVSHLYARLLFKGRAYRVQDCRSQERWSSSEK